MRWSIAVAALTLAVAAGCGDGEVPIVTAPVSGTATFEGKPLEDYSVFFYKPDSPAQQPSAGRVAADGSFTLSTREEGDGAIVGKNQVWLTYDPILPEADPGAASGPPPPPPKVKLPEKYMSQETSGLTVDVPEDGLTDYKLDLK